MCVRYMNGAATNPDAHAMAYAAAQTKTVMEVTQKLGTYVNQEAGRQAGRPNSMRDGVRWQAGAQSGAWGWVIAESHTGLLLPPR